MDRLQWGLLCGIAGVIGGAALLSVQTFQGQRAGQFDTWLYGTVRRSRWPVFFHVLAAVRWLMIGMLWIGALVLAYIFALLATPTAG